MGKPITLYFDQSKYDQYFVKNNKKESSCLNQKNYKQNAPLLAHKYINKNNTFSLHGLNYNINKNNSSYNSIIKYENKYRHFSSCSKISNDNFSENEKNIKIKKKQKKNLKVSNGYNDTKKLTKIQVTPKQFKFLKNSSQSSVKLDNKKKLRKFGTCSAKLKNINKNTIEKANTQSAFQKKIELLFDSGGDKNIKQKLLERMNNATKITWNMLIANCSKEEFKKKYGNNLSDCIQTPNKIKDTIDHINKDYKFHIRIEEGIEDVCNL